MSDMRLPRPMVREEFRKRLRADLVNEAVMLAEARRAHRPSFAERFLLLVTVRMRPIAVAAAVVAVLLAGTGVAAAGSLPGDPAFALKRAAEEVELALAFDGDGKVRVLAAQAERRLDELGKAASRPEKAPTASAEYEAAVQRLAAALAALRIAEPGTKRDAVEQVVEAARDKHVQVLEDLRERLPENAKPGVDRAIEQHDKIRQNERAPRGGDRPGASQTPRGGRPSAPPPRK